MLIGTSPPTGCPEGDPNSLFRLSPYVEQGEICYNFNHYGYVYDLVVYTNKKKPYPRRVTVFGWRNGNRSSIPNTYSVTIPANAYSSNRASTFPNATMSYSSILVEVSSVFKQTSSGPWGLDTDYKATCAEIEVQNCYYERLPCHLTGDGDCGGDEDGDGVDDSVDLCPNTEAGHAVDSNGCSAGDVLPPTLN